MREYNENAIYSFKVSDKPKRELKLLRKYTKHGKEHEEVYWIESTTEEGVVCIPDRLVCDLKPDTPHGFRGRIKEGCYFIDGNRVSLTDVHQIYNGVAYARLYGIECLKTAKLSKDLSEKEIALMIAFGVAYMGLTFLADQPI